jgi:hypothetical protein
MKEGCHLLMTTLNLHSRFGQQILLHISKDTILYVGGRKERCRGEEKEGRGRGEERRGEEKEGRGRGEERRGEERRGEEKRGEERRRKERKRKSLIQVK